MPGGGAEAVPTSSPGRPACCGPGLRTSPCPYRPYTCRTRAGGKPAGGQGEESVRLGPLPGTAVFVFGISAGSAQGSLLAGPRPPGVMGMEPSSIGQANPKFLLYYCSGPTFYLFFFCVFRSHPAMLRGIPDVAGAPNGMVGSNQSQLQASQASSHCSINRAPILFTQRPAAPDSAQGFPPGSYHLSIPR